jgi:hypothetical protein
MGSLLSIFRTHWDHEPEMCKCFGINDGVFRFTRSRGEGQSTFKDTRAENGEMYPKLCSKPAILARKRPRCTISDGQRFWALELGVWGFFGYWGLGFGVSALLGVSLSFFIA